MGQSKYAITAGQSNVRQPSPTRMILDGITSDEKLVAAWRRRQAEIDDKLPAQEDWLNDPASKADPRYAQRMEIHAERLSERRDLEVKAMRLLDTINAQIDTLEGAERAEAVRRLLSWQEAPF